MNTPDVSVKVHDWYTDQEFGYCLLGLVELLQEEIAGQDATENEETVHRHGGVGDGLECKSLLPRQDECQVT